MSYTKIEIHEANPEASFNTLKKYVSEEELKKIKEHLRLLALGEISGKVIKERRITKLTDMFILFFKNFNKPLSKATMEDVRKFKEDLLNNKIRKENRNQYSEDTKEDVTTTIVRYLECEYPKKVMEWASPTKSFRKWFIVRSPKKTPEYLSEDEIEKLYNSSLTIEGKFLIACLFDSGARIEEFLNLRFEDIEQPTVNFPYYKFDFKTEYSKTEGRKIGMYWKHSTEAISKYLAICEKKEMKEQIFKKEYDAIRIYLTRIGKKHLNKRVHPHMLRKSSATYYADKLNRQQLCIRYGWKFSSEMPDVYISRAGVDEGKVKEVMFNDDLNTIKKENHEIKFKFEAQEKEIQELKKMLFKLYENKGDEKLYSGAWKASN